MEVEHIEKKILKMIIGIVLINSFFEDRSSITINML